MAMITRIARLFKADFNSILDRIEEPEQLLRQAIRDIEDDVAETEHRIRIHTEQQDSLSTRSDELARAVVEIDEQLDFCFDSGKDELARNLVRKKLEAARLMKGLEARHAANSRSLDGERVSLSDKQATLESLRQKAGLFSCRTPAPAVDGAGFDDLSWPASEAEVGEEEVELAFLREKARRNES